MKSDCIGVFLENFVANNDDDSAEVDLNKIAKAYHFGDFQYTPQKKGSEN